MAQLKAGSTMGGKAIATEEYVDSHSNNTDNPHETKAAQIPVSPDSAISILGEGSDVAGENVDSLLGAIGGILNASSAIYRWKAEKTVQTVTEPPADGHSDRVYETVNHNRQDYSANIEYGDSYTIEDGAIKIVNPISTKLSASTPYEVCKSYEGKYMRVTGHPAKPDVVREWDKNMVFRCDYIDAELGSSSDDTYSGILIDGYPLTLNTRTDIKTVYSEDPNAYVDGSTDAEGWTYTALTPVTASIPKIEYGEYVGTGTYGSENPNRITFQKVPKLIMIFCLDKGRPNIAMLSPPAGCGGKTGYYAPATDIPHMPIVVTVNGNTVSFYNSDSSSNQMNGTGITYHYTAIE